MTETVAASAAVSLTEQARRLSHRPGTVCGVAVFRAANPDVAIELDEALTAGMTSSSLVRALRLRRLALSEHSLARHRRGDCQCDVTR